MTIALDANVKTLTEDQLDDLYMALVTRQEDVLTERRRRDALPFVWESDVAAVAAIRKALGKSENVGTVDAPETWKAPTSAMDAYIAGDYVTTGSKTYLAVGNGAIYAEPGVDDPIQGAVWEEATTDSADVE